MCRIRVLRIRESGSLANFDSWRPKTPGLLAKRPSKRPEKDPKNRFTGPDFENTESNRGSRVLILRIRSSSNSYSIAYRVIWKYAAVFDAVHVALDLALQIGHAPAPVNGVGCWLILDMNH